MEMLLEECFCSVIMETIFQQGSWLRPAPPPHNQEFLALVPRIVKDHTTTPNTDRIQDKELFHMLKICFLLPSRQSQLLS